jgi:hypothetical protein
MEMRYREAAKEATAMATADQAFHMLSSNTCRQAAWGVRGEGRGVREGRGSDGAGHVCAGRALVLLLLLLLRSLQAVAGGSCSPAAVPTIRCLLLLYAVSRLPPGWRALPRMQFLPF